MPPLAWNSPFTAEATLPTVCTTAVTVVRRGRVRAFSADLALPVLAEAVTRACLPFTQSAALPTARTKPVA